MTDIYLKGSGHFAIGFGIGFFLMLLVQYKQKSSLGIQMYAPFIPFIIGAWAAIPYIFYDKLHSSSWLNIFLFYDYLHFNEFFATIFSRVSVVALFCGSLYLLIVVRYITLVKRCRRRKFDKKDIQHAR